MGGRGGPNELGEWKKRAEIEKTFLSLHCNHVMMGAVTLLTSLKSVNCTGRREAVNHSQRCFWQHGGEKTLCPSPPFHLSWSGTMCYLQSWLKRIFFLIVFKCLTHCCSQPITCCWLVRGSGEALWVCSCRAAHWASSIINPSEDIMFQQELVNKDFGPAEQIEREDPVLPLLTLVLL